MEPTYSIKDLIDKRGFSTSELAKRLKTEPNEEEAWVTGNVTPSDGEITQLATMFGVRPD